MRSTIYITLCCFVLSCQAFRCVRKEHKRDQGGVINTWPKNTVPYEISDVFPAEEQKLIRDTLQHFTKVTNNCIKFVPHTNNDKNWVQIINGAGCSSPVGMQREEGAQELSLERDGCMLKGTIMHEFIHALGFEHEQSRPDRDKYVKILYSNVEPNSSYNFDKEPNAQYQIFGLPYDYRSVMHYGYADFTINCLPTIVPVSKETQKWRFVMGKVTDMSTLDVTKVKKMYGCA